jgi:hypothetical protein
MQVGYDKALEAFAGFEAAKRAPSLHPFYILTDAERCQELQPVFFVYEESGAVYYHGFHVAKVAGTNFVDIQSPYGYGGPVSSSADEAFLANAWASYTAWCLENNVLVEFVRFHPLLENWRYYQGEVIPDRQTVWLSLENDDLLASYNVRARTAVRKALKEGLRVEWMDGTRFAGLFPNMYRVAMTEINADDFYHFNDGYFARLLNWDKSCLAVCFSGDEAIAGAIFLAEQEIMEYHLSASTPFGKKMSATNLILHEAALLGQKKGCCSLHLGGGTDSRADNALLFFKAGFSHNRGLFKIGKQLHQAVAYKEIKDKWLKMHGTLSNNILFYRT